MEKLGFKPFPGTLNIKISKDCLSTIEALQREGGIKLIPPDPQFCEAKVFPVSIGNVSGAIIIAAEDVQIYGKDVIEVLAPVKLKEVLSLRDGDRLALQIEPPRV